MREYNARLLPFVFSSRFRLLCTCGFLVLMGNAHAQSVRSAPDPDVFAQDARMKQKVKVHAPGLAIKDLLARLSQATGVMLTADKITAEDKVVVFSPAQPLGTTLTDVAALFNDAWRRDTASDGKPRYLLTRSLRASALEDTLLNNSRNRLMIQLDAQVRALAETPEQLGQRPANDPIRKNLTDAQKKAATQVYAALAPDQRDLLFSRRFLNFSANAINPQMREPIRKLYEVSIRSIARFRPPDAANPAETIDDYARHGIQFAVHTSGGHVLPAVHVFGNGSMQACFFAELDARRQWILPPHGSPYVSASPAPLHPDIAAEHTRKAGQEKAWINRLRALAELSGKPVMADFYRSQPINAVPADQSASGNAPDAERPDAGNVPAANKPGVDATTRVGAKPGSGPKERGAEKENIAALDALCLPVGYLWWTRGDGALLFRKRDWYEQRLYEAPEDWLHETVKRMAAQNNTPTLADALRARQLTTQQILGLNSLFMGENYSYSETEAAGTAELLTLLERQLATNALSREPMKLGRGRVIYSVEGDNLLAARDTLAEFVNAQARPLSVADMKIFRVEAVNMDRGTVPEGGFSEAEVALMWNVGREASGSQSIRLPFRLPDDRSAETVIELVAGEK